MHICTCVPAMHPSAIFIHRYICVYNHAKLTLHYYQWLEENVFRLKYIYKFCSNSLLTLKTEKYIYTIHLCTLLLTK